MSLEHGALREFVADGHDVASSMTSTRWRTPSGAVLVEGASYLKVWKIKERLVRIDPGGERTYKVRGGWEVASERKEIK